MTTIINFFAGPGAGKSTSSAALFAELKKRVVNAELVTEFAKDCVWENRFPTLDNQIYVFAKQHHRLHRLIDKVDIVVTDSPLLLSVVYNNAENEQERALDALVVSTFKSMQNINFFIKRSKPYQTAGRMQTETEAIKVDKMVKNILFQHKIPHTDIDPSADAGAAPLLAETVLRMKNEV